MCHDEQFKVFSTGGSMFWNEFTVLYINTIHIVPPDWSTHLSSSRVHVQGKSCVHTVVRLYVLYAKSARVACVWRYTVSQSTTQHCH